MNDVSYVMSKKSKLDFWSAVDNVTEALQQEGFGIVSRIDLQETFKRKLDVDFRNYIILGACNPRLAYEALLEDDQVGVFLPCGVVVQEHDSGEVEVCINDPESMMKPVDNLNIKTFGTEVKQMMQQVLMKIQ